MDFRVKCCLLCLVILGCSTHVTSQDAASPAAISKIHATNAGEAATTGVPSKLPVPGTDGGKEVSSIKHVHDTSPGTDGGKEVSTIKHVHDTSPGVLGMLAAHTTQPTHDSKHGIDGGKEVSTIKHVHDTSPGVLGMQAAHTTQPTHDSKHGTDGGKEVSTIKHVHDTSPGVLGMQAAHTTQPTHDSKHGAIGKKEDHTLHPGPSSPPAHAKAHRPKHLISRIIRPPTVDPVVLQNDYIILCLCAPGIVFWLVVLVIVTIRRKRKGKA